MQVNSLPIKAKRIKLMPTLSALRNLFMSTEGWMVGLHGHVLRGLAVRKNKETRRKRIRFIKV